MDNALTFSNTAATVTFTFGDARGVLASYRGKEEYLSPNQAEEFIEALKEAGYRVA